jgi:hypothetical protein
MSRTKGRIIPTGWGRIRSLSPLALQINLPRFTEDSPDTRGAE